MQVSLEFENQTHRFTSELDNIDSLYLSCDGWVNDGQSDEYKTAWATFENTGEQTELSVEIYNKWLLECKIIHEVISNGEIIKSTSYKDLI